MITILPESHDNVIGIKASGKITDSDYKEVLIPKVDEILSKYDKSNFLYYLSDEFEGFELGAMWDDMKYGMGHHEKFDKIAFVGGPKWMEWSSKLFGHFVGCELKTYKSDELNNAWDWLNS